jgi:hypothetical protein
MPILIWIATMALMMEMASGRLRYTMEPSKNRTRLEEDRQARDRQDRD